MLNPAQFKEQLRRDNERYLREGWTTGEIDRAWDISRAMKRGYIDEMTLETARERIKAEKIEIITNQ